MNLTDLKEEQDRSERLRPFNEILNGLKEVGFDITENYFEVHILLKKELSSNIDVSPLKKLDGLKVHSTRDIEFSWNGEPQLTVYKWLKEHCDDYENLFHGY